MIKTSAVHEDDSQELHSLSSYHLLLQAIVQSSAFPRVYTAEELRLLALRRAAFRVYIWIDFGLKLDRILCYTIGLFGIFWLYKTQLQWMDYMDTRKGRRSKKMLFFGKLWETRRRPDAPPNDSSDFSSGVLNNKCAQHTGPRAIVHLSQAIDFSLSPACEWSKSAYPEDIILNWMSIAKLTLDRIFWAVSASDAFLFALGFPFYFFSPRQLLFPQSFHSSLTEFVSSIFPYIWNA